MTKHEEFAVWLKGFKDLNTKGPTERQWKIIAEKLDSVFKKEWIPSQPDPTIVKCGHGGEALKFDIAKEYPKFIISG